MKSQPQKDKYCTVALRVVRFTEAESGMVVARDWGKEERESYLLRREFQFGKIKKF